MHVYVSKHSPDLLGYGSDTGTQVLLCPPAAGCHANIVLGGGVSKLWSSPHHCLESELEKISVCSVFLLVDESSRGNLIQQQACIHCKPRHCYMNHITQCRPMAGWLVWLARPFLKQMCVWHLLQGQSSQPDLQATQLTEGVHIGGHALRGCPIHQLWSLVELRK